MLYLQWPVSHNRIFYKDKGEVNPALEVLVLYISGFKWKLRFFREKILLSETKFVSYSFTVYGSLKLWVNVKNKTEREAVKIWMNLKYSINCKAQLRGNPVWETSFSVLSAALPDCHQCQAVKKSEKALWLLYYHIEHVSGLVSFFS